MSENYHHRRLASEGSRVKLPWAIKINLDYSKTIEILDNLYFDKSRYVTRSVANHLNDISKLNTNLVIETLIKWKKRNNSEDIEYIISHSTRNLVKK
jgi:3-methyladenine DNA glycosylase AlkC